MMLILFLIFGGLASIFGFLVSAYFTFYKLSPATPLRRKAAFLISGAVVALAIFALAITVIWPPVM